MDIEKRKAEIINSISSCKKEKYTREEKLSEMLNLQNELLNITFNKTHENFANMHLWDIAHYLEQLNKERGGVASKELEMFRLQSKQVSNLIKAEVSGNRGEQKVFKELEHLQVPNVFLKNIEFNIDSKKTELDAIVFTPKGITIVEVKNTSRNIFIDEQGNFYRTGDYLHRDCNIAWKMKNRESLLRNALSAIGYDDIFIHSLLVFTNPNIEVHNNYPNIQVCFLKQLNYFVEDISSSQEYTLEELNEMANYIFESSNRSEFFLDFDSSKLINDFATIVALLENTSNITTGSNPENVNETVQPFVSIPTLSYLQKNSSQKRFLSKTAKEFGGLAAIFILTFLSSTYSKKNFHYNLI